MTNLSFHITDIVANSIRAGATRITLKIMETDRLITLQISDNGCGMDEETIRRVTDPFYTTRTTRRVGLGLPFLIQNAEQTGGDVCIESTPGEGTTVTARFVTDHIDCPPWGDLAGTLATTLTGNPDILIHIIYNTFELSTEELKEALNGMPLSHPQVTVWVKELCQRKIH